MQIKSNFSFAGMHQIEIYHSMKLKFYSLYYFNLSISNC